MNERRAKLLRCAVEDMSRGLVNFGDEFMDGNEVTQADAWQMVDDFNQIVRGYLAAPAHVQQAVTVAGNVQDPARAARIIAELFALNNRN